MPGLLKCWSTNRQLRNRQTTKACEAGDEAALRSRCLRRWLQCFLHEGNVLKYLMWLLNAAIFFVLFAFALNNQAPVTLRFFFGTSWQAPLVLVLLMVLVLGVFLGILVMLPLWLRVRKRAQLPAAAPASGTDTPPTPASPHAHDRP